MKDLIGSLVEVSPPFINDKMNLKEPIKGKLDFIGPNEYLGWYLQVTINRLPLQISSITQIKILD